MDAGVLRMEDDPDGNSQQVAVIMTGQVYRDAGLKYSKHPVVEGLLYDKLCKIGKHKLRDDVRKMALHIAMSVSDHEFRPTVAWLDNFMRRFCLSKKKMGFHSSAMLKQKVSGKQAVVRIPSPKTPKMNEVTQEEVFSVLGINLELGNGVSNENKKDDTSLIRNEESIEAVAGGVNGSKVELNGEKLTDDDVPKQENELKDENNEHNTKNSQDNETCSNIEEPGIKKELNAEVDLVSENDTCVSTHSVATNIDSSDKVNVDLKDANNKACLNSDIEESIIKKETVVEETVSNSNTCVSTHNIAINVDSADKEVNVDLKDAHNKACLNSNIENKMEVQENIVMEEHSESYSVIEKASSLPLKESEACDELVAEKEPVSNEKESNDIEKKINNSEMEKSVVEDLDKDIEPMEEGKKLNSLNATDKEKESEVEDVDKSVDNAIKMKTVVEDSGNEAEQMSERKGPDSSNNSDNGNEEDTSDSGEHDDDGSNSSDDSSEDKENSDTLDEEDKDGNPKSEESQKEEKKARQEDENITYSKAENKYYRKNLEALKKRLAETVIRCTSCNEQVNHQLRSLVHTHPVLKVFICKRCRKYYGRGKFCKDEEGYDEYCRLCAEGGDLLCCEREDCFNGFCKRCVKRTMGRSELKNAESTDNWACYVCDPSPMMELRALHRTILSNLKTSEKQDANLSRKQLSMKKMKSKFEVLKRQRIEKHLKDSNENDEGKNNAPAGSDVKASKVPNDSFHSLLKETIENMSEMLSLCLKNVNIIESKWNVGQYSQVATEKAGKHVLKQLHAIQNNFKIMENELESNIRLYIAGMCKTESIGNVDAQTEESVARTKSASRINESVESDVKIEQKETLAVVCENENSVICRDSEMTNRSSKRSQRKTSECEESDAQKMNDIGKSSSTVRANDEERGKDTPMEVDDSQDSSKALFRSEDEHSLPDLQNAIDGILSDRSNDIDGALEEIDENNDIDNTLEGGIDGRVDFDKLITVEKENARKSTRLTRSTTEKENKKDDGELETMDKRRKSQKEKDCDDRDGTKDHSEDEDDVKKSRFSKRLRKINRESVRESIDDDDSEAELQKSSSTKTLRKSSRRKLSKSEKAESDNEEIVKEENKRSTKRVDQSARNGMLDSGESEEERSEKLDKVDSRKKRSLRRQDDGDSSMKECDDEACDEEAVKEKEKEGVGRIRVKKDLMKIDGDDDGTKDEKKIKEEDVGCIRVKKELMTVDDGDGIKDEKEINKEDIGRIRVKKDLMINEDDGTENIKDEKESKDLIGRIRIKKNLMAVEVDTKNINDEKEVKKEIIGRIRVKKDLMEVDGDDATDEKDKEIKREIVGRIRVKKDLMEVDDSRSKKLKEVVEQSEDEETRVNEESNDEENEEKNVERGKKHSKKRGCKEEEKNKKGKQTDERVLRKRNKQNKEEEDTKKRVKRHKGRQRENEKEKSLEKTRSPRKRRNRKADEDEDEDVLLGLVEESSESSEEEDTDQEMKRREADRESVKKREGRDSKKMNKVSKDEDDDDDLSKTKKRKISDRRNSKKVDTDNEENITEEQEEEANKEKHTKSSRNQKKKESVDEENRENKNALASLLASDSDKDETHDMTHAEKETKDDSKMIVSETSSGESAVETKKRTLTSSASETEKKEKKMKKKSKDGKSQTKNDNQKAKAALLESESEDDLEDKPKPRCKKKNYKISSADNDKNAKRQHLRNIWNALTDEEREILKEKQLNGKCQVDLKEIGQAIKEKIEEDDYVYVSDFPELYSNIGHVSDSDNCDADEEESDKEFTKLMSFKVTKYSKPAPKSKKKLVEFESEQEENVEKEESKLNKKLKKDKVVKKKKEGLLDINIDKEEDEEDEDEVEEDNKKKKKKEGGISLNEKMKKQILMSSDEEVEDDDGDDDEDEKETNDDAAEEEKERKKYEKKKQKEEALKQKEESSNDTEEEYLPKEYKKGYMNLNISSDDEVCPEDEEAEYESDDDDDDDSDFEESPRKKRAFQISSSESEDGKKRKRKKASSSESDSEDEDEEKPKSKRKRIKKMTSSSDEDEDGDKGSNKEESPSKHKKIRRVIRDEDLLETTKNATIEEEERRKRIAERQKQYNKIFEIDVESDQKDLGKLVLDFDPKTKLELVSVHEKLVKFLKPHQFKGIKFMWDATIESLEMLKDKPGSGCILAHCMGLGKTLQVITFVHTLLVNKKTCRQIQRVMVCCPVNTVYNWVNEFTSWLKGKMLPFDVVELASAKDLWGRAYRLDDWWREGGVCIMGYDMFRNLSNCKSKRYKGKMKEIFKKTLINPGPDIMVCDEGHILKNENTALSKAINQIKTSRRIVLTGTPLQNNLKEYHCMIQFVKPNLLGTKKEFMNRFVNPIEQGQCVDAMPRDVRRMKRRAHILHNLLEGCVQRFDYTVLKPFLPPKFEYVISVQLSEIQCKLYQYYLDNLAQGGPKRQGSGLFVDFGCLSRVWTHPRVLELAVRRALFNDDEEEMDDFICDDTTTSESSDDERSRKKKKKKKDTKKKNEESEEEEIREEEAEKPGPIPGLTESGKVRVDWWKKVLEDFIGKDYEENEYLDKVEHSGKLILLLDILRECSSIGDKVLIFSQSLLALDMIEDFLQWIDEGIVEMPAPDEPLPLPFKQWKKERDYLRLDGSSTADTRKNMCKTFNNPSNERCRLFLISTRAGGLGINLVAANRVIIFDSSWNPSHDTQSIFRVYRFGQKKPCYVYRFVAQGTMEEKIYSRQVTKMSTALRVVDEHQIKRYFKMDELAQLYEFNPADVEKRDIPIVPEDRLLAEMLKRHKQWIVDYHEHDSLLENQTSEELSEEERKAAWEDYENEKKGFMVQQQRNSVMPVTGNAMMTNANLPSLSLSSFSFEGVVNTIKAQNPNLTQQEMCESVVLATKQIQKIHINHYQRVQSMVYNLKNPMIAPEQRKLLPFGNHPEMLPMLEQQLRMLEENIQRENQVINHMSQITPQRDQMSAGLIRGHPPSTGLSSAVTNYVGRSVNAASTSMRPSGVQPQKNPSEKKPGSNDVIMLD